MMVDGAGPRSPARHLHDHLEDLDETLVEGRPVLEVDRWRRLLGSRATRRPCRPGERLVDGLEVVQAGGQQERQRRADEAGADPAAAALVDPAHLVGVEHRAAVGAQVPGGARVDDDQGAVAEGAG